MKFNNDIIKLALVGCGRISEKHFSAISEFEENLRLEAVCDPYVEKLKNTNKPLDKELKKADDLNKPIKIFSNYDNLLEK